MHFQASRVTPVPALTLTGLSPVGKRESAVNSVPRVPVSRAKMATLLRSGNLGRVNALLSQEPL